MPISKQLFFSLDKSDQRLTFIAHVELVLIALDLHQLSDVKVKYSSGAFAKLRKAIISDVMSVRLMEQLDFHCTDFRVIRYLRKFRNSY
jgi:hypothetical protein